jgi:hypothetical protein
MPSLAVGYGTMVLTLASKVMEMHFASHAYPCFWEGEQGFLRFPGKSEIGSFFLARFPFPHY